MAILITRALRQWRKALSAFAAGFVLLAIAAAVPPVAAQTPTEHEVKAAFLYNFSRFVVWPAAAAPAGKPFVIGILGDDPFEDALGAIVRGKSIDGRPLIIRQFKKPEQAKACQILFVSSSEEKRYRAELESLKGSAVLTVGETSGFIEAGGIINFTVVDSKVHFEINPDAARDAGLQISSRLLNLAKLVRPAAAGAKP